MINRMHHTHTTAQMAEFTEEVDILFSSIIAKKVVGVLLNKVLNGPTSPNSVLAIADLSEMIQNYDQHFNEAKKNGNQKMDVELLQSLQIHIKNAIYDMKKSGILAQEFDENTMFDHADSRLQEGILVEHHPEKSMSIQEFRNRVLKVLVWSSKKSNLTREEALLSA